MLEDKISSLINFCNEFGFKTYSLNQANSNISSPSFMHTPLTFALETQRYDLVPALIYFGADPNYPNNEFPDVNALGYIITRRPDTPHYCEILQRVINLPSVYINDQQNIYGYTPLMWATYHNKQNFVNILLKNNAKREIFSYSNPANLGNFPPARADQIAIRIGQLELAKNLTPCPIGVTPRRAAKYLS